MYYTGVNKVDGAASLFKQGFNCAQALLAAYAHDVGIKRESALKIASPFGGGIGRMGDTCGAVAGAFMIIGLKHGLTKPDKEAKMKLYRLTDTFIRKFKSRNTFFICRDLLGLDAGTHMTFNEDVYRTIENKCPQFVKDAAEIIEEIL